MRQAIVKYQDYIAGTLTESTEGGYIFEYSKDFINHHKDLFIVFNMPVNHQKYTSNRLFPFFDGLIPEGYLLDLAIESWRINKNDRMGLLLALGKSCIGAVSVHEIEAKHE